MENLNYGISNYKVSTVHIHAFAKCSITLTFHKRFQQPYMCLDQWIGQNAILSFLGCVYICVCNIYTK